MPRFPRSRLGSGVFHVCNRAHDRRFVFGIEEDKQVFLSLRPVIGDESSLAQAVNTVGPFISRRVGRPRKS